MQNYYFLSPFISSPNQKKKLNRKEQEAAASNLSLPNDRAKYQAAAPPLQFMNLIQFYRKPAMELSQVDEGWSKWCGKAEELGSVLVGFVRENGPSPDRGHGADRWRIEDRPCNLGCVVGQLVFPQKQEARCWCLVPTTELLMLDGSPRGDSQTVHRAWETMKKQDGEKGVELTGTHMWSHIYATRAIDCTRHVDQ